MSGKIKNVKKCEKSEVAQRKKRCERSEVNLWCDNLESM